MISTLLRIQWTRLRRDRVAQTLTFVVPIIFFSIFALIFGTMGSGKTPSVRLAVVDEDQSAVSKRVLAALGREDGLKLIREAMPRSSAPNTPRVPIDRERATAMVQDGDVAVALIVPKEWGKYFPDFGQEGPDMELLADTSNPVAPQMTFGLLQKVAMSGSPDLMMEKGLKQMESAGSGFELSTKQREQMTMMLQQLRSSAEAADKEASAETNAVVAGAAAAPGGGVINVKKIDLLGAKKTNPAIAFYAAGIAVMFLLFTCTATGGSLLEEAEDGTLERLLSTRLGMTGLLMTKWLYIALVGVVQITVMFVWGALVFGLELWSHLPGFIIMTTVTAGAAGGFGMCLATVCRSRGQLNAISNIVILTMSALGGSMVPRAFMPEGLQKAGLFTFNGWALDGFLKVFWRERPLWELWPQVSVLVGLTVLFLWLARRMARRWETV